MKDEKTTFFINEIEKLIAAGIEPSYKAIADKIGWHNNSITLAKKGKRAIPYDVFNRFKTIYKAYIEEPEENDLVYKEKYIALLEKGMEEKNALLENEVRSLKNDLETTNKLLHEAKHSQLYLMGMVLAFQEYWLEQTAQKDKLPAAKRYIGQKAIAQMAKLKKEGTPAG